MDTALRVVASNRTIEEFATVYEALPAAEKFRLMLNARTLGKKAGLLPDDLLHDALLSVLAGGRPWPSDVAFMRFMIGVMRSLVSVEVEKRKRSNIRTAISIFGPEGELAVDQESNELTAEATMISAEEVRRVTDGIIALLGDDEAACFIFMARQDGLEGAALREATGLSETDFDTKRKYVRRKTNAFLARETDHG